ncbi:hypothetical protein JX085_003496 [Vibrio cholerae]|uniref:hypothetical protein n=1 Tax=Vibrio cholerae TaxID=666 RepID=UPI0022F33DC2|nr:hypothetical protein [Vibrio cholerae]EHB5529322.1 hypothetical protein [Vibrio cholerae]EJL6503461.1 hypothetical protein [Vibrio cholerae]MDA5319705.1 hypothetical protein [Vibrio cholerae]
MKHTLVLGASIIAASAIIGLDKINDIRQFGNVIELTSGKVRLGEVYRETLSSTYEVTFVGDDRPTTSVQSNTKHLYSSAFEELKNTIDEINKSREGKKEEPLSIDSVTWSKDAKISLVTTVTYQSEFHPNFVLTIDETTIDYDANSKDSKNVSHYLSELKSYSDRMVVMYETNNSFIK